MRVLGVDPGLANLGLGVVEGDVRRAACLHQECVTTPSSQEMGQRLLTLHQHVSAVLDEFQPDVVAMEDQILRRQADVAFKVGQAYGVVQLTCGQRGLPVYGYGPMQVKKALVGTGRAEKAQVIYMVKANLGLRALANNHAADALALALTHLASAPLASRGALEVALQAAERRSRR
ncbi:crossover junction endodeoxyribonuclease RuvC [Deinococcus sp. Marseille-Q6407]|uniref:crossover junction endodeoxyribonuclease RuvC n=1 Tax=Deinococcus sp. Marseille-Q6407 TaxID=2969223 RepID=UPI0021C063F0|nr:crossover junction endodeoxyribonuclease RuvC [Deinococcus sp. Marseille-Q6407]